MAQQPPATDKYARLAGIYQKALSEADASDDPEAYKTRARAAYDRAVTKVAEESAQKPAALPDIAEEVRQPMGAAQAIGTALATGIPGVPAIASAVGAVARRKQGESFGEAYQQEMKKVGEQEQQAKEELYPGMGTALQLAPVAMASSKLPLLGARAYKDAPMLAKALAAGKRVAGASALAGVESAGRQGMSEQAMTPGQSMLLGAGVTALLEAGFPLGGAVASGLGKGLSSIPVVGPALTKGAQRIAEPARQLITESRRGIADLFQGTPLQSVGKMIEPTDATRVQRLAEQAFPTAGQTVPALQRRAERAAEAASSLGKSLTTAEEAVAASKAKTGVAAKALEQRSVQQAEQSLLQLRQEAERAVGPLRTPQESAAALRDATRKLQTEAAQPAYKMIESLPPSEEYPRAVYQQMKGSKTLYKEFLEAAESKRQRILTERLGADDVNVMEGVPAVRMARYKTGKMIIDPATGEQVAETVPKIDLEILDTMRRNTMDQMDAYLSNSSTGISRSQGRKQLAQINLLENNFLKSVPGSQRAAITKTRADQTDYFRNLDYLRDGQNIRQFTLGAKEEILGAGKNDLRELLGEVSNLRKAAAGGDKAAKAAVTHFEVGVRQAIADMAESTSDDAADVIAKLVGTPQARMQAGQALSPDFIRQLQYYLPEQMKQTAQYVAGPTKALAERMAKRAIEGGGARTRAAQSAAQTLEQQLQLQQVRASELARTASAAQEGISALGSVTAGRGFVDVPRTLGAGQRKDVAGAMATTIRDEVQGLSATEAIAKLRFLQQNPAAREMFGPALNAALAELRQKQSLLIPMRSAVTGQAAGRF